MGIYVFCVSYTSLGWCVIVVFSGITTIFLNVIIFNDMGLGILV